jgi:hypothetical protein
MAGKTRVFLEIGTKRVFASAADWPGWCRSGKNEQAALENLAVYAPRYGRVTRLAHIELTKSATSFDVVERLPGNATTDFGAPGVPAESEKDGIKGKEKERMCALVEACWKYLDQARATAPEELRKGPRGGGRDRDKMFAHVLEAEWGYSRYVGLRLKQPDPREPSSIRAFRKELLDGFGNPNRDEKWPVVYAARRVAWHALDHAWEMEDRLP